MQRFLTALIFGNSKLATVKKDGLILAYIALAAVCVIWGTTYLAIRLGVTEFPPFLFSGIRFILAGPLLLGILTITGRLTLPDRRTLIQQAFAGILMCSFGVGVVGWGELRVSSGLAAIICSVMPVWVILINLVWSTDDRPTLPIVLGLLTGLAGILLIFSEHLGEFGSGQYTISIILTFLANICWAFGSVWLKKNSKGGDPFLNAGLQMTAGGIFLLPMSLVFDDYSGLHWSADMARPLLYLILIGSVGAYTCYSYAIKKLPMTIVSIYAYINPIVAVLLGWLILGEKLNARIGIGIVVTVLGIYIVNKGYQLRDLWKAQWHRIKSVLNLEA